MVWKLTQQQINYGRQHLKILTTNVNCTTGMNKSKISIPSGFGITGSGTYSTNWGGSMAGLYGCYQGHVGRDTSRDYCFRCLKYFVPVQVIVRPDQYSGKGWGSYPVYVRCYNAGAETWFLNSAMTSKINYTANIPDSYLLNWDLSASNSFLYVWYRIKTSGAAQSIMQIKGFQVPYPNMAAFKDGIGNTNWPLQTIGYKDDAGVVKTAGRLL